MYSISPFLIPDPKDAPPAPPPQMPDAAGDSVSIFTPKFLKALSTFTGAFPTLDINAKNSTLRDLLRNDAFMSSLSKASLLLISAVAEMVDRTQHPNISGFAKFVRNVLALERVRREIQAKFVIQSGSNRERWELRKKSVGKAGSPSNVTFEPPGLDDKTTLYEMVTISMMTGGEIYGMQSANDTGKEVKLPALLNATAKSVYLFGKRMNRATSKDSVSYECGKREDFYFLQVFRVDNLLAYDGPVYLIYSHSPIMGDVEPNYTVTIEYVAMCPFGLRGQVIDESQFSSIGQSLCSVHTQICNRLKFTAYDPKMFRIGITPNNEMYFHERDTRFTDTGSLHILPEYDVIKGAIGRCIQMRRGRGYAFVGYPGTGKSVLMNQLAAEFNDIPLVNLDTPHVFCAHGHEYITNINMMLFSLKEAGYGSVIIACDDFDSEALDEKNGNVTKLIRMFDSWAWHGNDRMPAVIFMCTINDPTTLHTAIIRRAKRIDEVIDIGMPDAGAIRQFINVLRDPTDTTDYTARKFRKCLRRMAKYRFTLADLSTMLANVVIYGNPGKDGKQTPENLMAAIERLKDSHDNASRQYK